MGVTIHYQGRLDNVQEIDEFCEEITDISKELDWNYHEIDDVLWAGRIHLKGIITRPHPDSESLAFIFDDEGFLSNYFLMKVSDVPDKFERKLFIKTQFAPPEVHVTIIKLLKYFKKKYFSNLEVYDEGDYWEKEDYNLLCSRINFLSEKINQVAESLSQIKASDSKNPESLMSRIEEVLKKRFGNEGN
jgi:hypothetical protein